MNDIEDIKPEIETPVPSAPRASRSLLAVSTARRDAFQAAGLIVPNLIDGAGESGRRREPESPGRGGA